MLRSRRWVYVNGGLGLLNSAFGVAHVLHGSPLALVSFGAATFSFFATWVAWMATKEATP